MNAEALSGASGGGGVDVAGVGMGRNGRKTESWLPTSARTARSRIRNGSRRGMAGAGYARDMAWGAAWGLGRGSFTQN